MRTATLKRVIDGVARRLGWHPEAGISPNQRLDIVGSIDECIEPGWGFAYWPETMAIEQRTWLEDAVTEERYIPLVSAEWSASPTYAIGDIVARYGLYYEAILAGTNQDPLTATTYWTALDQTPIGKVLRVTSGHPLVSSAPYDWPFVLKGGRLIALDSETPDDVWVTFQRQVPVYGGELYDVGRPNVAGDLVYDDGAGESYKCLRAADQKDPATETGYWSKIDFPAWLVPFMTEAAAANLIYSDDRQAEKERLEESAEDKLAMAVDREMGMQGMVHTARVEV